MQTRLKIASVVVLTMAIGGGLSLHAAKSYGASRRKAASTRSAALSPAAHPSDVSAEYGRLPLAFEPNVGQAHDDAKFLARGDGYALFLNSSSAVLALREPAESKTDLKDRAQVLGMQLVGANASATFAALEELPGKSNYLIGRNPAEWHTNVPTYRKVAERGIYPGVDMVYYGTQRQLEYDFVVAPEASLAPIRLAIEGVQTLRIDESGEVVMTVAGGEVRLRKPVAYQQTGTDKQTVAANYTIAVNREVGFEVGNYDHTRPLIIDPILAYSTYLGGSNIDGANAVAVASDNTAFVAGGTFSTDFPTAHPLQLNHGGGDDFYRDAFVTKFSADGSTLLYSTYLGGSNEDYANGIAVDVVGNAYVVGTTLSHDFPVTPGSFGTLCGGDGECGASFNSSGLIVSNGFLTKLNAAGSGLIYSGYIGTYENVGGLAVAVDANQIAYVTGQTANNGFSTSSSSSAVTYTIDPTGGAFPNGDGTSTIVVTSQVVLPLNQWVTLSNVGVTPTNLTGTPIYDGNFMVLSSSPGRFVILNAGGATSGNGTVTVNPAPPFPITTTAYQTHFGGGSTDLFVAQVSATGNTYLYSTYLGGDGEDVGNGIAVDKNADMYVTGLTYSGNFPTSGGAFQSSYGGVGDAFVAEINTNVAGTAGLVYSTYLGGTGLDQANGIAVDPTTCTAAAGGATACDTYVAGGTASTGLGTAGAAYPNCDMSVNQCQDAFVAELRPGSSGAESLAFFTYLGGSLGDTAAGIGLDPNLNIYITGSTVSTDFPTLGAPFQASYGGGNDDAFVVKFNPSGSALLYSSYLGGTDTDNGYGIAVDASGSAYVTGQTCSVNFPVSNPEQVAPGANCDAFVSKVQILDGIQLNPSSLVFSAQSLNTLSSPETLTITNGDVALTGLTISPLAGTNPGDFADTSTCTATMQPGTQCTITAKFTPTGPGVRTATIKLTDSAPNSPQTINLTGTTSTLTLSTSSLTFSAPPNPPQPVGVTSASQPIKLTNNGTTAITISSVTASGDFGQTNNCTTAALQPTTNCVINVTYTPSGSGTSVGAITINDSAPGSPQVIIATGTAAVEQFAISALAVNPTVPAGQAASYTLSITPYGGFSQPVALSCSGLPFGATCSASQNPVTLAGSASTQVTLNVNTEARTTVPASPRTKVSPPPRLLGLVVLSLSAALLTSVLLTTLGTIKDRRILATMAFAAGALALIAGCNGGSRAGAPSGTPAGTYQVTITATSANATTQSTVVTLQVK